MAAPEVSQVPWAIIWVEKRPLAIGLETHCFAHVAGGNEGFPTKSFRPLTGRDYQRSVLLQPDFGAFPETLLGAENPDSGEQHPRTGIRNSILPSFLLFCEVRLLMHAHPGDEFLSCDWGTSTFRIRWISKGEIAQEYVDTNGCKTIFAANSENQTARAEAFENQLHKALSTFGSISNQLPLVISGMASSTIGWRELPYAPIPLKLDGSNLRVESVAWKHPALISETYLVSGAASKNEMMRGEETEAIGLLKSISSPPAAMLILPGTHSKHLSIASDQITGIQTFMTGELYELLTTHSVLRASVNASSTYDLNAFEEGIYCVIERGLCGALFQTRTRQVLQAKPPEANASFLSGALIGAEFEGLKGTKTPLLIAGSDPIRELYAHAAKSFDLPAQVFSSEQVKLAVPCAHQLILTHFAAK